MAAFRFAGVMGWPISHSRSPVIHGHWLKRHGIAGTYLPLPVRPETLEQALRALPILGFAGCNLTAPHKEIALDIIDRIDPAARRIGSVNTVVVAEDGTLDGFSTDGYGFIENLKQQAPAWCPDQGPVVIFGAGGSARAIIGALLDDGVTTIRLINRSRERAVALLRDAETWSSMARLELWDWERRDGALDGAGLVVNTTTQGMTGEAPLDIDLAALPPDGIVADIVYAPLETPLLAAARARGHVGVDGLGMLLHQARPGFEAWFGVLPEVDEDLWRVVLATFET